MNSLMTTLSPTATAMIRKDHAMVLGQFRKLEPDTSPQTREATIRTICAALEIHAQVEEELFYPAMREAGVDSPVLAKSKPEHDRMRELMQPLTSNQLEGQPAEQIRALDELMNTVMHHMADEETQLLPAAASWLSTWLAPRRRSRPWWLSRRWSRWPGCWGTAVTTATGPERPRHRAERRRRQPWRARPASRHRTEPVA